MSNKIITICLLLACFISMCLCGCWDSNETDRLAIIGALGIDKGTKSDILLSAEILNYETLARGLGQIAAKGKIVGWVMLEEGTSVSNILSNIQQRAPRQLYIGQVHTIIFGQNISTEGIGPYIDYFVRNPQIRRSVVLISCDTASGCLQRPFVETLPSQTLIGLSEFGEISGRTTTLNEFLIKMKEPGIEPIMLHTAGRKTKDLQILTQGEDPEQESPATTRTQPLESEMDINGLLPQDSPYLDPLNQTGTAENLNAMTILLGIAAYKNDKLVGTLDENDARGYLWAVGKVQSGILEVVEIQGHKCHVGASVLESSSSIKPIFGQGLPRIQIEVKIDFELYEHLDTKLHEAPYTIDSLQDCLNKEVKSEIMRSLSIVQNEFKSDIYGFGQTIYRKKPEVWELYAQDWNEKVFPYLEVEVEVSCHIRSSGMIVKKPY